MFILIVSNIISNVTLKKKKKNFALLDQHKTRLGIHFFFSMFLFLFLLNE